VTGLRVHLVSEHASPLATVGGVDAGGQNVHVAALAIELARLGCEVTVFTRADDSQQPPRVPFAPGVVVEHVVAGPVAPVARDDLWPHMREMAHRLRTRWRAERPDVVHAHFWMSGWAACRALAGVDDPPPLVQTFHALGVVKRRHQGDADTSPPARDGIERQLVGEVDQVVATCSDEVAELRALGMADDRVKVVPCGVDTRAFRPDGPHAPPRDGGHRIVSVGRLVARKGVGDVIAALPRLPGTELLVAGGPPYDQLDTDAEATRLRALAQELGVGDRVRLLGAVARPDVPPLLRSADVVACVPWYEPFGIVPLEAMACGIPVVGSAIGGLLDTIADRRTGLLVPPRDPEAVTDAIGRLLDGPSVRVRMGEEAVARVRRRFTWPQVAQSTLDVYRCLVGDTRGTAGAHAWAVTA
jgi:glycosyltransferase involved in cell wall biosynthesis